MESLADFLGCQDLRKLDERGAEPTSELSVIELLDITDPMQFCQRVLASREFRQYLFTGIACGDIPPAVMCRVIDHAWGKPVDRVEHTGKDGQPIETVTEVRRVIVRVGERAEHGEDDESQHSVH